MDKVLSNDLAVAMMFCTGLFGFIVFILSYCFAKRGNNVYLVLGLLNMLFAICCLTYNSEIVSWAYVANNKVWNVIATFLVTAAVIAVFFCAVSIYLRIVNHIKYSRKAKAAGMDVMSFAKWKEKTVNRLVDRMQAEGKKVHYSELLALYEEEEKALFAGK